MLYNLDTYNFLKEQLVKDDLTKKHYHHERLILLSNQVDEINRLKEEKNAVILAHTYVGPEIINTVADYSSDSYALAVESKKFNCDTIVLAGVRFMAETAKMLNPEKTVLLPDINSSCSLAESITADDVKKLKKKHPKAPVVCYINSSAEVKALVDVVVTSSNALQIIKQIPDEEIIFIPDKLMAKNIQNQLLKEGINKKFITNEGTCIVHDNFDEFLIHDGRKNYPDLKVLSHPECSEKIVNLSDLTGSTTQIMNYVEQSGSKHFMILSECGLTEKMQNKFPEKVFVASCKLCPYMKMNSLEKIRDVLKSPNPEQVIVVNKDIAEKAILSINKMFSYLN